MTPVYVDPFLGAASVWLALLDPRLVAPCAWMGGKRRLAAPILWMLGLEPGRPIPALLGDASWWGWVWPLLLDPITSPMVRRLLRSWREEEPRALWFRLRDAGPPEDPIERAAGLLWLQARAASGVPVWWDGADVVSMDGHGRGPYPAWQATCTSKLIAGARPADARTDRDAGQCGAAEPRLVQWSSTKVDDAGQRNATEPRLLASDGRGVPREAGHKVDGQLVQWAENGGTRPNAGKGYHHGGADGNRGGGMVDPGTIADRVEAIRRAAAPRTALVDRWTQDEYGPACIHQVLTWERRVLRVEHRGALDLTREWALILGDRARVYLDPPYQGATGYPATCPRDDVLVIADTWATAGATVVLSEAVSLAAELGTGWEQVQLRAERKPEWVTVRRGRIAARHGPLFGAAK